MERRRPNWESKNSEDVQDALIEDYFRYNDLSRMEADEYIWNWKPKLRVRWTWSAVPRDLSANLNEDSDSQKENVVPNKRFRMVTDEETGDMKWWKWSDLFTSIGDERAPGQIPPKTLTVLWLDSSWVYSKKMVLNMNQILWVPCTTALTDTWETWILQSGMYWHFYHSK